MSAEARRLLILIDILSNSYPTPTPNTCLKYFSWHKLEFEKFPYSYFKLFIVFGKFPTKFDPWCSYKIDRIKKECILLCLCVGFCGCVDIYVWMCAFFFFFNTLHFCNHYNVKKKKNTKAPKGSQNRLKDFNRGNSLQKWCTKSLTF